jgi:hypothetical protein
MSRLDISDGSVLEKIQEIVDPNSPSNWVQFTYVPQTSKLKVGDSGEGGMDEIKEDLNDGKVFFYYIRYLISGLNKYCYIAWCGEGVTGMVKGNFNNHTVDFANYLRESGCPMHVQVNARSENDLNEDKITAQLKKAVGSNYDLGQKIQGVSEGVNTTQGIRFHKDQQSESNKIRKRDEGGNYIDQTQTTSYWNQSKQDEDERKKQLEDHEKRKQQNLQEGQKEMYNRFQTEFKPKEPEPSMRNDNPQDNKPQPRGKPSFPPQNNYDDNQNQDEPEDPPQKPNPPKPFTQPPKPSTQPPKPNTQPPKPSNPPPKPSYNPPSNDNEDEGWEEPEDNPPPPKPSTLPPKPNNPPPTLPSNPPPTSKPNNPPPKPSGPPPIPQSKPVQSYDQQDDQQYDQGYDQQNTGYDQGYDDQQNTGYDQGYDQQNTGYDQGYDQQYDEQNTGNDQQYDEQNTGNDQGYDDQGTVAGLDQYEAVTAKYDFTAQQDGDLTFKIGETIYILEKDPQGGWWSGMLANGNQGVFPSNFVE